MELGRRRVEKDQIRHLLVLRGRAERKEKSEGEGNSEQRIR